MFVRPSHSHPGNSALVHRLACFGSLGLALAAFAGFGFLQRLRAADNHLPNRPASAAAAKIAPHLAVNYGKLPLSFEVNQGQTDESVKFLSRGRGYGLFLTGDEAVLTLGKASQKAKGKSQNAKVPAAATTGTADSVLRLRLVGANTKAAVMGAEELPGKVNYFIGNDPKKWRTNVPTYAEVKYRDVYPGVDLVYYGNQSGQLEYDFVVAPGADPSAIALDVAAGLPRHRDVGAGLVPARKGHPQGVPLRIAPDGDLVVQTEGGEIRFHKPVVYQEQSTVDSSQLTVQDEKRNSAGNPKSKIENRKSLDGHYVLTAANQIHFELGAYDHTQTLVIDPVLVYSTYLGGSNQDYSYGIAVDSSGNAYVAGYSFSTNFPTVNPLQASLNGSYSPFVAKLNSAGSALVYSTYLGGSNENQDYWSGTPASGIAVDSSGNAYVTGQTNSTDFPTTTGVFQASLASTNGNAFVAKLNPTGSALVYSTYLGGNGSHADPYYTYLTGDCGNGIAVDSSGSAYVTGYTHSTNFPTVNPLQASILGAANAFVAKLNAAGSALIYSTYLGGHNADYGYGVAVDASGTAYVTGQTNSTDFPTANPLQWSLGATNAINAFVSKLNAAGSALVYSTYLGGSYMDGGYGIAVDSSGNAYVTGTAYSSNFPTASPLQTSLLGETNAFVAKLNAAGSALVYSTYLGGHVFDGGSGIAVDSSGNAYVTGYTHSTDFPTTTNAYQAINKGDGDAFVAEFNSGGSALAYSTYLGGSGQDAGNGIAVDISGNAYVAGSTNSTNFPIANPVQASLGGTGATNAFVAKISPSVITFSPANVIFGQQNVGASILPIVETVTNTGTTNITISAVTIGGADASDFATSADNCTGATVTPNGTCTVSVTFTPLSTGIRSASLIFIDNLSSSPQMVNISGTAILPSGPLISPPIILIVGATPVGTSIEGGGVSVKNTGSVALGVISISTGGGVYTETDNCTPSIPAGGSCAISITFTPVNVGPECGYELTITDYAVGSPQFVQLCGSGESPIPPNISPGSLGFSAQMVGTTSGSQPLAVTNNTAVAGESLVITISGDWIQSNNCQSNGNCTIYVSFAPTASGPRTGMLTIWNSFGTYNSTTSTVSLSGTGVAPVANLLPPNLSYGNQQVGTSSSAQQVMLNNTGTAALTIANIATSPNFSQAHTCSSSLGPGSSCAIYVKFSPTSAGVQYGSLTVTDNSNGAAGSTQTVNFSGTGTVPLAQVSAASLAFGNQDLNTRSASKPVTLSNTGNGPLTIASITTSGSFGQTNDCGSSVAAGGSCMINVTFSPTAAGEHSANLYINDNSNGVLNSRQTISLTGTGIAPITVTLNPASASKPLGGTQFFTASITGTTNTTLHWYVNGVLNGDAEQGTLTGTGFTRTYHAPAANVPSPNPAVIKVVSAADPSKYKTAKVTVTDDIVITINPTSSTRALRTTQRFTATITGTTNTALEWYVNGVLNGNSTEGTLTGTGQGRIYTAPSAHVPSPNPAIIKVVSVADPAKYKTASVTVTP